MASVQDLQQEWYVVYSKPHQEDYAQFHLRLKGVDVFFPRLDLPGSLERKKRLVPLFPNYLFVRIHLAKQYQHVIWSPGVKRFVHFGDTPIPLEDEIVDFLRRQADGIGVIKARSRLKAGQEVEIHGGPFDGLLGIMQEPPDDKGRVKVLLKLLSRGIKVELPAQFIKGEWVPYCPRGAEDIEADLLSVEN